MRSRIILIVTAVYISEKHIYSSSCLYSQLPPVCLYRIYSLSTKLLGFPGSGELLSLACDRFPRFGKEISHQVTLCSPVIVATSRFHKK